MDRKKILSIQDLVVKFRVRSRVLTSIRNVSFDIYDGETVAIVGESGSGKSVLTKTMTNMLEANGYIANGSIIYYPSEKTKEDSLTYFKEDIDLVKFHKGALESDSRRDIAKYNKLKIKNLASEIRILKTLNKKLLEGKIQELEQKIENFSSDLLRDKRKLKIKDKFALELKKLKHQLKLLSKPERLEFEIQQLEQSVLDSRQEIANFSLMSINKKLRYYRVVSFIKKFWRTKEFDGQFLSNNLYFLSSLFYKSDLEEVMFELLNNLQVDEESISEEQIRNFLELWNYSKKSSWSIRAQAHKKLNHLRGGTIATIFQDPMTSLNPLLSVGYQISEVLRLHQKMNHAEAKIEAINLMKKVGIPNAEMRFHDLPGKYSGGMRQRIVIAIALACRPKILICDEPTTALDVTIQAQILELIKELKKEYGFTVIFITHDLGVVSNIADRVAVVYAGQIIEYGLVKEIFINSQHPYTWALLSSLPQLGRKGEDLFSIPGSPPSLFNEIKGDAFAPRNKYALAIDYEYDAPFFEVSPTHKAKTWLLDKRAPKVKRPKELEHLIVNINKNMTRRLEDNE